MMLSIAAIMDREDDLIRMRQKIYDAPTCIAGEGDKEHARRWLAICEGCGVVRCMKCNPVPCQCQNDE
jgi:hypothetical protein